MVKNAKTWMSWEWNIIFLWNKEVLNLCFKWYILRSYHFVVQVTFKWFISCSWDIEVCNFADDTIPFVCDLDITTLNKLEENSAIALTWFEANYMKLNSNKCHLLVSGHHYEKMFINIGNNRIWVSKNVELLVMNFKLK